VLRKSVLFDFIQKHQPEAQPEVSDDSESITLSTSEPTSRDNKYNKAAAQIIDEFFECNNYLPKTVAEVRNRLDNKQPGGYTITIIDKKVSINGSEYWPIKNFDRAIQRAINQRLKNSADSKPKRSTPNASKVSTWKPPQNTINSFSLKRE
jgi:hypothetical protein